MPRLDVYDLRQFTRPVIGLDVDWDTADANASLHVSNYMSATRSSGVKKRLGHTITPLEHETGVLSHVEPEPTPTTLMGEQLTPRRTLTSCKTTPSRPRRNDPLLEFAYINKSREYVCGVCIVKGVPGQCSGSTRYRRERR